MTVFEKLNLKDQREILVINAPASFEAELSALENVTLKTTKAIRFAVAFATQQAEYIRPAASKTDRPQ